MDLKSLKYGVRGVKHWRPGQEPCRNRRTGCLRWGARNGGKSFCARLGLGVGERFRDVGAEGHAPMSAGIMWQHRQRRELRAVMKGNEKTSKHELMKSIDRRCSQILSHLYVRYLENLHTMVDRCSHLPHSCERVQR
jgi:hypothetical protein